MVFNEMLREVIREALLEARRVLRNSLAMGLTKVEGKGWSGDYSRQFDILTEKAIIRILKNNLDRAYVISEEIGEIPCSDPDFYVLVDPVDGSINASRGLPFYASSIAIAKSLSMNDVVAAGVIDHQTGTIYLGDREQGVTIDGNSPSMNRNVYLRDALICVDLSSLRNVDGIPTNSVDWCVRAVTKARHARFFAAACLEIAFILEGKTDAFICLYPDLKVMDFCASANLVKWAGGEYRVIGGEDEPLLTDNGRFGIVVASTRELLEEIFSLR